MCEALEKVILPHLQMSIRGVMQEFYETDIRSRFGDSFDPSHFECIKFLEDISVDKELFLEAGKNDPKDAADRLVFDLALAPWEKVAAMYLNFGNYATKFIDAWDSTAVCSVIINCPAFARESHIPVLEMAKAIRMMRNKVAHKKLDTQVADLFKNISEIFDTIKSHSYETKRSSK